MPNPATIIAGLLVAAVFIAIVARGIYNRRRGKSSCSCGGGCGGCACAGMCHPQEQKDQPPKTAGRA